MKLFKKKEQRTPMKARTHFEPYSDLKNFIWNVAHFGEDSFSPAERFYWLERIEREIEIERDYAIKLDEMKLVDPRPTQWWVEFLADYYDGKYDFLKEKSK